MTDAEHDVITVDILGQRYPIRSSLDTTYVTELATYVDRKMQTAAEKTSGDSVRVAVLAALNIADEYFRIARRGSNAATRTTSRSNSSSWWTGRWPASRDTAGTQRASAFSRRETGGARSMHPCAGLDFVLRFLSCSLTARVRDSYGPWIPPDGGLVMACGGVIPAMCVMVRRLV